MNDALKPDQSFQPSRTVWGYIAPDPKTRKDLSLEFWGMIHNVLAGKERVRPRRKKRQLQSELRSGLLVEATRA